MILDIALAALFLIIILIYIKRGFVKSIWGLARIVVSVIASVCFGNTVGQWMNEKFILNAVTKTTYNTLNSIIPKKNGASDISGLFTKIPEKFRDLVQRCGADIDSLSKEFSNYSKASDEDVHELAGKISEPVSDCISTAAGYVVVFIFSIIVMFIIGKIIILLAEVPVLDKVNGTLGGILGAISGFFYLWIICLFLGIFVENAFAQENGEAFRSIMNESVLFRFFCQISPFDFINIKTLIEKI